MSATALAWALKDADAADPLERLVLVVLGDSADDDGYAPYRAEKIAAVTTTSVEAVEETISGLVARGVVESTASPFPGMDGVPVVRFGPPARFSRAVA